MQSTEVQERPWKQMATGGWTCPGCNEHIMGQHSITRHETLFREGRCTAFSVHRAPPVCNTVITDAVVMPACDFTGELVASVADNDYIPDTSELLRISRRFPSVVPWLPLVEQDRVITRQVRTVPKNPRDVSRIQFAWRNYRVQVRNLCSDTFWRFFLPMHTLSATSVDTALHCARAAFNSHGSFVDFPLSTRCLL